VAGVIALCTITITQLVSYYGSGQTGCLAVAVSFGVPAYQFAAPMLDTAQAVSTQAATLQATLPELLFTTIKMTSVYLVLFSVMVLVVLEAFELRYLRQLLKRRHSQTLPSFIQRHTRHDFFLC
jgi:hypothetical protein